MRSAHCHPRAEHGQDYELACSALERPGQREGFQAQQRPNAALDGVNNLSVPVLMEQSASHQTHTTTQSQQTDQ